MAGIYLHIPFCRTRCIYCDFFSSTLSEEKEAYIDAVCEELQDRKNYLQGQTIQTIYFGGGTPSQLSAAEIEKIFHTISAHYALLPLQSLEITLEVNPDDMTSHYVDSIRHLPFNRISIGIQSFNDKELQFLLRRHDASTAINSVKRLQDKGYDNIGIDLIYGLPGQTLAVWENNLNRALALDVRHISAYHLTYEEGTPLFNLMKQGLITPAEEALSLKMFETGIDTLTADGFEHYEISNFARPGYRSKHNASYWNGTHYLGIGASAHSYNGLGRHRNGQAPGAGYRTEGCETEFLSAETAYNDFVITRLRTMEGIDLRELLSLFGEEKKAYCLRQAQKYISTNLLQSLDHRLRLTRKGIFVSDGIMSDLLILNS